MAVRIIIEVGKQCGLAIPLSVLMKNRTVADMAAWIDDALISGATDAVPDKPLLASIEHGKKAPLSYAQQQMWLLDQLNPGSVSYTVSNVLHFRTNVDLRALDQAVSQIVERHEILRTTSPPVDGQPFSGDSRCRPGKNPADQSDHPSPLESRQPAAKRQMRELARIPWDLKQGPLFRCQLFKLGDEAFTLGDDFASHCYRRALSGDPFRRESRPFTPPLSKADGRLFRRCQSSMPVTPMAARLAAWGRDALISPTGSSTRGCQRPRNPLPTGPGLRPAAMVGGR